jgi:hypothetical protein
MIDKITKTIKIAKRVNQRFRSLEKNKLQYYSYAYEKFKDTNKDFIGNTGYYTQSRKRLETFTEEQLDKYLTTLEKQDKMSTTKLRTVRKVEEESYTKLKEKIQEIEKDYEVKLTRNEREKLVRSGLLAIKEIDSDQIIEDWLEEKSKGVTIEEYMSVYAEFKDKFTDKESYTKIKKRLRVLR